jgi:hypothetical protein
MILKAKNTQVRRCDGNCFLTSIARHLFLTTVLFLYGCATGYQPQDISGGFSEERITANRFLVGFSGNGYTSDARAVDLAGMRCAELAINHGFKYVIFLEGQTDQSVDNVTVATVSATPYGAIGTAYSTPILKPNHSNLILCSDDVPVRFSDKTFDAKDLFEKYKQKYNLKVLPSGIKLAVNQETAYKPGVAPKVRGNPTAVSQKIPRPISVFFDGFEYPSEVGKANFSAIDHGTITSTVWPSDVSKTGYFQILVDRMIEEKHFDYFVFQHVNDATGYGYILHAGYGLKARIGYTTSDKTKDESGMDVVADIDDKKSFAYRDGLRIGDKIRKINDIPVDKVDDLVIEKKKSFIPGNKIRVNVVRNGELKDLEIELVE